MVRSHELSMHEARRWHLTEKFFKFCLHHYTGFTQLSLGNTIHTYTYEINQLLTFRSLKLLEQTDIKAMIVVK